MLIIVNFFIFPPGLQGSVFGSEFNSFRSLLALLIANQTFSNPISSNMLELLYRMFIVTSRIVGYCELKMEESRKSSLCSEQPQKVLFCLNDTCIFNDILYRKKIECNLFCFDTTTNIHRIFIKK